MNPAGMKRALDRYFQVLRWLLTLLLALMIVPVVLQILSRHTGIVPRYIWTEEAARFCFVWIIMIGSIVAVRQGTHFCLDILPPPRTPRAQGWSQLLVHASMAVLAAVFAWHGIAFAALGYRQNSEMSGINLLSIYVSFPLAGVSWALFLWEKILEDLRLLGESEPGS